jgi:hypothetical protein
MSEERSDGGTREFPPFNFPTIFADGISNAAYGQSIMRLYLARNDPSFSPDSIEAHTQPFAQLVMSLDGFVATTLFLQNVLSRLITENFVTEEQIAEIRARRGLS